MSDLFVDELPDFTETEVADATRTKKLRATTPTEVYKWRITSVGRDISNPEKKAGGWMLLVVETVALKPNGDGSSFDPTSVKTKRWICLPRVPAKASLLAKGYPENLADKVLESFNPNGVRDFAIKQFREFAKAMFPESFTRYPGYNKDSQEWFKFNADGSTESLGIGDAGKDAANLYKLKQTADIKTFAANVWKDPQMVFGKEFYDGYKYEVDKSSGKTRDAGSLNGWPSATVPFKSKTTEFKTVLDPTKNII